MKLDQLGYLEDLGCIAVMYWQISTTYMQRESFPGSIAKPTWIDTWTGDCKNIYSFVNICVLFIPLKSLTICVH